MLRDLRPLFAYMRRYKWGYVWGSLCVVGTNGIYVLFPKVLEKAIDGLRAGHHPPQALAPGRQRWSPSASSRASSSTRSAGS